MLVRSARVCCLMDEILHGHGTSRGEVPVQVARQGHTSNGVLV